MPDHREPHYYQPDSIGDKCVWCDNPEKDRPHVAVPKAWKPVIATLARNTLGFHAKDITEYTAFDRHFIGKDVVRVCVLAGYLQQSRDRHKTGESLYTVTPRGWEWIEAKEEEPA